jgi:hypothetical protein
MQPVPITTKVVSLNPAHGEVLLIQHYVIKFVSGLRQVGGFLRLLRFSSTNKTDHHDITEILLKVALNTITKPNQTSRGETFRVIEDFFLSSITDKTFTEFD